VGSSRRIEENAIYETLCSVNCTEYYAFQDNQIKDKAISWTYRRNVTYRKSENIQLLSD
jgi:hypothetical protein